MPTLTTFIQHNTRKNPSQGNQARKRNKMYPNKKRRSKIAPTDDIIICIYGENPNNSTKKKLVLIKNSVKLQDKKMYKNQLHFYMPTLK